MFCEIDENRQAPSENSEMSVGKPWDCNMERWENCKKEKQ